MAGDADGAARGGVRRRRAAGRWLAAGGLLAALAGVAIAVLVLAGRAPWQGGAAARQAAGPGLIALTLRDAGGHLQIFTIHADGSGRRQLTFSGDNGRPGWSRDGRRLTYSTERDGTQWVAVMDADGAHQAVLTEGLSPDWSPDGRLIAFARPSPTGSDLWTLDVASGARQQVTRGPGVRLGPSWSPDGTRLAFIAITNPGAPGDPRPRIGVVGADGSGERLLTAAPRTNVRVDAGGGVTVCEAAPDANAPAWSPVDGRIAFWSGLEGQYGQIWVMRDDGSGGRQLTADCSHGNSDDPSWSPDGRQILFSTGRSGRNELWVMDADGSHQRRLSEIDAAPFPGRAAWQPVPVARGG